MNDRRWGIHLRWKKKRQSLYHIPTEGAGGAVYYIPFYGLCALTPITRIRYLYIPIRSQYTSTFFALYACYIYVHTLLPKSPRPSVPSISTHAAVLYLYTIPPFLYIPFLRYNVSNGYFYFLCIVKLQKSNIPSSRKLEKYYIIILFLSLYKIYI